MGETIRRLTREYAELAESKYRTPEEDALLVRLWKRIVNHRPEDEK